LTGSDEDLSGDVVEICSLAAPTIPDSKIDTAIQSLFWDRAEPLRFADDMAEGWAITVLELVDAVRPTVVPPVLRSEVSRRVVLPWLLAQSSHRAGVGAFTSVLMQSSNEADWQAAAALLTDAARDHVLRNELAPSVPNFGTADAQLIVSGLLLTEIFNSGRARHRPLDPEAANRWEHFVEMTRDAVVAATATAKAARKLLQSQGKDDTTLLALILGKATSAPYRVLTNAGDELIRQYFRPLVKTEESREQEKLPYLGPLIVNDLVNIWIQIRADEGFFSGLAEGLRCDEYAFEFTYGHYLTDRSRAMILAAIGAVVGVEMGNDRLRAAALALADSLRSLPEGVVEPFDEASRADLAKRTGIGLPAK
jgi:hypothetical protein